MHSFIQDNLAPLFAGGLLVGMFVWVAYLNVSYANEKKREAKTLAQRGSLELCHRTCEWTDNNPKEDIGLILGRCAGNILGTILNHALEQRENR
jgi:hypothetical protein